MLNPGMEPDRPEVGIDTPWIWVGMMLPVMSCFFLIRPRYE